MIWPDVDALPVLRANQFIVQVETGPRGEAEGCIVTIGFVAPPVILGSAEEQQVAIRALGAVEAKALARVSMSRARVEELIGLLASVAQAMDGTVQE